MRSATRVVTRPMEIAIRVGMGRERREIWTKRVERWRDSGLTAKEFASEIGVNPDRLRFWKWQLGKTSVSARTEAPEAAASAGEPLPFVEVTGLRAADEQA